MYDQNLTMNPNVHLRLKNKSPQTLAAGDFQPKPYHNW